MLRHIMCLVALVTLSACATTPNALDTGTRASLFVKDADIVWKVEDATRLDKPDYVAGKDDLVARLDDAVEDTFRASPAGAEAVSFRINVTAYSRVNAAVGNIIGGSNLVVADVDVVRVSDGRVLGTYKGVSGIYASNGGILGAMVQTAAKPDIVGIMANTFAANLRSRFDKST